jgi:phenylacetate-CoA ligase
MWEKLEDLFRNSKNLFMLYQKFPYPLSVLTTNLRAIPIVKMRYSKRTYEILLKILERDEWDFDKLASYTNKQLKKLLDLSKEIPYYSGLSRKFNNLEDFPVLTRDFVKENFLKFRNPNKRSIIRGFTSGTCGSGMQICYDSEAYMLNWAYYMKQRLWIGIDPREWRITFYGSRIIPPNKEKPPFWIKNYLEHQYLMSIFHLSDKNAKYYIDFLDRHQGLVLEGFPSVLYLISKYVKAFKSRLRFKAIFTSSEPLYPFMRQEIEKVFSAKVVDSYGMSELCGLILECEKGNHHVMLDYGYLEILNKDDSPVSIGEEGDFVWTGFINDSMPLIRYKIGDKGIWEGSACSCGKPYPIVKPTITRDADYLITPSGKILSARTLSPLLKNKISINLCQFVQKSKSEIIIRFIPFKNMRFTEDLAKLKKELKSIIGDEIYLVEEISSEPIRRGIQGKIPLILSSFNYENLNKNVCK